jgi:hypothetical protein
MPRLMKLFQFNILIIWLYNSSMLQSDGALAYGMLTNFSVRRVTGARREESTR